MKFLKWLFKEKQIIEPNAIWQRIDNKPDNSFSEPERLVKIIAIENGWVNYKLLPEGGLFQNESLKESTFRYCYEFKR